MQPLEQRPARPDARTVLSDLVGKTIATISDEPNTILAVESGRVLVATGRSPEGAWVPIVEIQSAIDKLFSLGAIEIRPRTVGYRSAFIGAVLKTLPGTKASLRPARIELIRQRHASPATEWSLTAGDRVSRTQLHDEFGGNRQRGISPSAQTPEIFVFSHPESGETHGYMDHWEGEILHYYGEGQRGDQTLTGGNLAIATQLETGRPLRVFEGAGSPATYLGTFETDEHEPFYWTVGRDQDGSQRKLVVFRLKPVGTDWIAGSLPALQPAHMNHDELQTFLADLVAQAGATPFYSEFDETLFELGWVTDRGTHVIAEVRDFDAGEEAVLSRGLGHLLMAQFELEGAGIEAAPILFVPTRPSNPAWIATSQEHGVTVAWPAALEGIPLR